MGKNKKKKKTYIEPKVELSDLMGRPSYNAREKKLFSRQPRTIRCIHTRAINLMKLEKIDHDKVWSILASNSATIEHQMVNLRNEIQLTQDGFMNRYRFSEILLDCLRKHHNVNYQGVLFGSTINGLGLRDSDVDIRLRQLECISNNTYEPIDLDDEKTLRILYDLAYRTQRCCPAVGSYISRARCPISKLTFYSHEDIKYLEDLRRFHHDLKEGFSYDISICRLFSPSLAFFNSKFLRFLCQLEPKFHLLATVLRYWSKKQNINMPGYFSSYALVIMLIHFCQNLSPPLLPSLENMRELYFKRKRNQEPENKAITQLEWHCAVSMKLKDYKPSANTQLVSVLLLKFFEYYLNFPYSSSLITIQSVKPMTYEQHRHSPHYHPRFRSSICFTIQDPFDLMHNLTSGIQQHAFKDIIVVIKHCYDRLAAELRKNFSQPSEASDLSIADHQLSGNWGLNTIFVQVTEKEMADASK